MFIHERILSILGIEPPPVFYIGGSDTLPPPLPRAEEESAIAALDDGDEAARRLLIEHNLRLVVYISKRFENTGINLEDLISIGTIGLIKAVNTFNSRKNIKLATYASRCIENEILMYLRKIGSQRTEVSFDEPLNTDWDGNELLLSDILGTDEDEVCRPLEDDAEKHILMEAIGTLNEREREIIMLRFGLLSGREYTQKEVDGNHISQKTHCKSCCSASFILPKNQRFFDKKDCAQTRASLRSTLSEREVFSPTYTPPGKMDSIYFSPCAAKNSARLFDSLYSSMNSITSLTPQCRSLQSWFRVFVDMLLPLLME